ncbi:MAG: TonB-dependent receptor, partial [Gammaproteobacteria bacterium]
LSIETEPRWEYRTGFEIARQADGTVNETIKRDTVTDSQPLVLSANLGYRFSDRDIGHFNVQMENSDAPFVEDRFIREYLAVPLADSFESDVVDNSNDFWEIGGDFEHTFSNGNRWKTLFIVNDKETATDRDRLLIDGSNRTKDLYLATYDRYQEQIVRSSYSMGLAADQDLEFGIERAQTTLDSTLKLGLLTGGVTSPQFGGLTPSSNSNATVEEIRYEGFAVHNWQINNRMSLESTLIIEQSEISQSGDVTRSRDFDFVRPKFDYRFDLTPSLQLRATVEKDVAQLSFNDFTASADAQDDDRNEVAGNPEIRQEQSWRYDLNLEYRFDNDNGVLNTNLYYHDLEDVIDRIDVSTADVIQSANGNIGDGERYGIAVDASLRLASFNLPNLLITSRVEVEDGSVIDPFVGNDRRLSRQGRGSYRVGFRHDLRSRNINYGLNFNDGFEGGRIAYDVNKIEDYDSDPFVMAFLELRGPWSLTYRFEATNTHESERCRIRSRYLGGTIATGTLDEV